LEKYNIYSGKEKELVNSLEVKIFGANAVGNVSRTLIH
jgi:hypothetical protein